MLTWYEVLFWFYSTETTIDFYIEESNSYITVSVSNLVDDIISAKTFTIGLKQKQFILHNYLFYHKDIKNTEIENLL